MKTGCLLLSSLLAVLPAAAEYRPAAANLAARQWFQDARFGLFIHWGVYSVLGDGEWVMNNRKIPVEEYEKLPPQFNPTKFDAAEWVSLVKAAGMRYITITSKHHDGFAMFDSKLTDWDIVDRTPYKKDVLKMLADECHKQGIKLFFYHSHLDWHHPDYYPRGRTGRNTGRPESGEWYRYLDFMDGEIRELLTNYGEIGGIWFDGWWDKPTADWRLEKTYKLIHDLQPAALIGNNHHRLPFEGEDFQMFEKDLPGGKTAEFNKDAQVGKLPLETCETINKAWGYNQNDQQYKSTRELVHYLVRAAGHNANFLLNVGPRPDGTIQPEFSERLREIGGWLRANGESIYGTRQGPVAPRDWGVTTQKGKKVYVHLLKLEDEVLALPKLPGKITRAALVNGAKVEYGETNLGVLLKVPLAGRDPLDTVVTLELQ
ncbi:MAG: alpha-L-fucosidase [Acidobacteria bacterium]|nr:alpha-L-fucosidase [Acidobacteriota bacterium]